MWSNDYLDKTLKNNLQDITLSCSVKPTINILTADEAKNYLKISYDTDDSIVSILVKNASNTIENIIHKTIHKSSFVQKQQGGIDKITLMKCPIIGVPTVTYYENFDSDGEILTSNTDYRLVNNILYHSNRYFTPGRQGDGYSIEYDAGLFTSSTDDNSIEYTTIKNCMMRLVAFLYENREQFCVNFNEENWSIDYNISNIPIEIKYMLLPIRQENLGVL